MLIDKKVVVPAYDPAKTLRCMIDEIPWEIVEEMILTDDASRDNTSRSCLELGLTTIHHDRNCGYAGNEKTWSYVHRRYPDPGKDVGIPHRLPGLEPPLAGVASVAELLR